MPQPAAAKILVADDDQSLVRTLTWILKENGYEVSVAPGGEGLMGKLEEERPHLLLLDIMMPKVDGLQLLAKMKADERFRDLPVLMISSMPPEEATVKSLGLGAADFIAKPFRVRELLARVKAHIRTAQELSHARDEAQSRAAIVDILHEVTDSLKPDEIYHILVRRVARVLQISKCSMVLAKAGDQLGVVVAAYENPMLRNLQIELARYPEIQRALASGRAVLVEDVAADPLYAEERVRWERERITVPTRSAVALPFSMKDQQVGVFFLHHGRGPAAHPRRRPVRRDRDPHGRGGDREGLRLRDRGIRQEAAGEARRDGRPHRLPQSPRALRGTRAGARPRRPV